MKKKISILLSLVISVSFLIPCMAVNASADVFCETFDEASYTSNFATGGSPTTTIVSNPVSSIGGTVLRYANGTNTASWIKNSVPLVAANSSGTHEVGVDLYIPSTSITSTEVITIQINGNVKVT